jgi:hypothetical protein
MAEHLSGYQPEYAHPDGLPYAADDIGDVEGVHSLLGLDELEQIRQSAAAIEADMETRQALFVPAPPDETIPIISFVEADSTEGTSPVWGIEPLDELLLPEEAPTQKQREHARHYFLTLVSLADRRYRQEETLPEPQEIIEAYTAYRELVEVENQSMAPAEHLPDFTLAHLWAAARRQNLWVMRWLQDQRAYEAPEQYEEALLILLNIENGVAEAVRLLKASI